MLFNSFMKKLIKSNFHNPEKKKKKSEPTGYIEKTKFSRRPKLIEKIIKIFLKRLTSKCSIQEHNYIIKNKISERDNT